MLKIMSKADLAVLAVQGVTQGKNIIDWTYFDDLQVAQAGTTSLRFFQRAFGQPGVTLEQTNMEIPGQLPKDYEFVIQEIVLKPYAGSAKTVVSAVTEQANIIEAGVAQLFIGNRPFYQCRLDVLAGGGLHGFSSTFQTSNVFYAASRRGECGKLEYMPKVDGSTSFALQVDYNVAPTLVANSRLMAKLKGKLVRPSAA